MGQTEGVAGFLVGHEDKTQGQLGREARGVQGFGQQQHAHKALLIVFHPAAVQQISVTAHLPGIGKPFPGGAARHDVGMGKEPERARGATGNARHKVGTVSAGHTVIGSVQAAQIRYARGLQLRGDEGGLFFLALSAVFRTERTTGRQGLLQGDNAIGAPGKHANQGLKRQRHETSFAAEVGDGQ